jgi:2'-5' RNA ligase
MALKHPDTQRYFIAIVPPEPVYSEAAAFKAYFKDHFNSKASLNSPPHITLHMPFDWKESKENELLDKLSSFVKGYSPIPINLQNFGCFEPRVIFMNVNPSAELFNIQKELERFCKTSFQLFNAQYRDLPFHPHITLAFRDLKKTAFEQVWKEFAIKQYQREFIADRIALLRHDGKVWKVYTEFLFA